MPAFTIQCEYSDLHRSIVTVEAEDIEAACRAAINLANESDGWKAIDWERPTFVTAAALGADASPWRRFPEGDERSEQTIPRRFTEVAMVAGYAATISDMIVQQLRNFADAIDADGRILVASGMLARLRGEVCALLVDIDGPGACASLADPARVGTGDG